MTDNFKLIKDFIQSQWGGHVDKLTLVDGEWFSDTIMCF